MGISDRALNFIRAFESPIRLNTNSARKYYRDLFLIAYVPFVLMLALVWNSSLKENHKLPIVLLMPISLGILSYYGASRADRLATQTTMGHDLWRKFIPEIIVVALLWILTIGWGLSKFVRAWMRVL